QSVVRLVRAGTGPDPRCCGGSFLYRQRLVELIEFREDAYLVQLEPCLLPPFYNAIVDACAWLWKSEAIIETQNCSLDANVHVVEVVVGERVQQMAIRGIGERILVSNCR